MPEVYLLHFNKPYWANARHYIGYTKFTAAERCKLHREGKGSRLVDYALRHGCAFVIAHAEHLKASQGIRMNEDHRQNIADALGDIVIFLCDFSNRTGFKLGDCVLNTWTEVVKRKW